MIRWIAIAGVASLALLDSGVLQDTGWTLGPRAEGHMEVPSRVSVGTAASARVWMFDDPVRACAWLLELRQTYRTSEASPLLDVALNPTSENSCITVHVSDNDDLDDTNPGDGRCETASGRCSLRAALQEARAYAGIALIDLPSGHYIIDVVTRPARAPDGRTRSAERVGEQLPPLH